MAWTRSQARESVAMQQFVRPGERILHAELALQDAHGIFAAQPANAGVAFGRPGLEAFNELFLSLRRELGRRSAARPGHECVEAAVAIGVGPALHEAATSPQPSLDLLGFQTVDGQERGAIPVPLLSPAMRAHTTSQFHRITGRSFLNVHP